MPTDQSTPWFLRKHENGDVFGPVSFDQIRNWASNAYVNPQDSLSNDGRNWTKAPMIAELQMDWLIETLDNLLYGPTTAGAILEFLRMKEITTSTPIVNCCTAEKMLLFQAPFLPPKSRVPKNKNVTPQISSGIKVNLQQRIRDLEVELLEKRAQLDAATQKIVRLELRLHDLNARLRGKP